MNQNTKKAAIIGVGVLGTLGALYVVSSVVKGQKPSQGQLTVVVTRTGCNAYGDYMWSASATGGTPNGPWAFSMTLANGQNAGTGNGNFDSSGDYVGVGAGSLAPGQELLIQVTDLTTGGTGNTTFTTGKASCT